MDLKIFLTTFVAIFLAELGDKTQLATLILVTSKQKGLSVFLGASFALVLTSLIAVLFGEAIIKLIPASYLKKASGIVFILIGLWVFFGK